MKSSQKGLSVERNLARGMSERDAFRAAGVKATPVDLDEVAT